LRRRTCGWERLFNAETVVSASSGSLTYFTYKTPVETEQSESWQRVKLSRIGQQPLRGCAAAMPAMNSTAAASNSSCELTENTYIKKHTNFATNTQRENETNIWQNRWRISEFRAPWVACLPSL